jgi:hypothetical protein
MRELVFPGGVVVLALLLGCSNGTVKPRKACGQPPPTAAPEALLVYPVSGATGVPDAIGETIVSGDPNIITQMSLEVASTSTSVPIGAFTSAPSPLPSPNALPTGLYEPLEVAPLPTLSPATTYTVGFRYNVYPSTEPQCADYFYMAVGSFTTK